MNCTKQKTPAKIKEVLKRLRELGIDEVKVNTEKGAHYIQTQGGEYNEDSSKSNSD